MAAKNPPADRLPTMRDVARLAGVSLKTVSRVVNGQPMVAPALVARTNQAIQELNYRPNYFASQLKSGGTLRTIGLVAKNLESEFSSTVMAGIAAVARQHADHLITVSSAEHETSKSDLDAVGQLVDRRVDGIVVMPSGGDYSSFETFKQVGIPLVFVDREPAGLAADSVTVDNQSGAWSLVQKLVEMGHTRIAMLFGSLELSTMRDRRHGAVQALRDAEILVSQSPALYGLMDRAAAHQAVRHMLDGVNLPTALFCANSEILVGGAKALLERGHRATIATFEDSSFLDFLPLERVVFPADGFSAGNAAATLLYDRIREPSGTPRKVILRATTRILPAPPWGRAFGRSEPASPNQQQE